MKILAVHPSSLMYSKIFLRLEPLGIELIAAAARRAGHDVRLLDLQVEPAANYARQLGEWRPDAIALSCNYLANVPEVIELAKAAAALRPEAFVFVGGHSASFIARELLEHGEGAIDCVLKGEGEASLGPAARGGRRGATAASLARSARRRRAGREAGRRPAYVKSLDDLVAARDLLRHRRKYFIGVLDPCASIEFSRGCPWDCSFCSAWTFYGRSYRIKSPDAAVAELEQIREPGVFIVDDVAFIQAEHGMAIGEAIARRGIKKQFYLETRGDVLLRNKEVFRFWKTLGLQYIFLGVEAIDEEGLKRYRKRVSVSKNFEALEFARSLGVMVAINIIADPDWDRRQFEVIRQWCLEIPEIVNISVNTPYPGTESWLTESRRLTTRDYRLFDIQHAVLPTRLPLAGVLPGAGQHPAGLEPQAPGLVGRQVAVADPGRQPGPGPDQHAQDALEVQQRLRPAAPACRPPAARPLRAGAAAGAEGRGRRQVDLYPSDQRPSRPRARRGDRVVRQPDAARSRSPRCDARLFNRLPPDREGQAGRVGDPGPGQPRPGRGQRRAGRRLARSRAEPDQGRADRAPAPLEQGAAGGPVQGPGDRDLPQGAAAAHREVNRGSAALSRPQPCSISSCEHMGRRHEVKD